MRAKSSRIEGKSSWDMDDLLVTGVDHVCKGHGTLSGCCRGPTMEAKVVVPIDDKVVSLVASLEVPVEYVMHVKIQIEIFRYPRIRVFSDTRVFVFSER